MAIIKLGVTVVGIRGTVGGMTFSANKAGPYAQAWYKGANPRTLPQTAQRGRLGSIPQLWRALSGAQQTAWDTFAALPAQELFNSLGESYFISGFGWFSKTNIRLIAVGRATTTATPVIARPAAPTITSLQLPFLAEQYAKVVYPSGEFAASQDIIIEIATSISDGRQVAPSNFLSLARDQDPNDTETGFLEQYNTRVNLTGLQRKGFALVYRQTTEGLRSSPGAVDFISTDSAAYVAVAADYDGTTRFALRGADLTGNADSKVLLLSVWFRVDAGDGTVRRLFSSTGTTYNLQLTTANKLRLRLENSAGTPLLIHDTDTVFAASAAWHNVVWAVDLADTSSLLAVDGAIEAGSITAGPTDDTIDYTVADHSFAASAGGVTLFDGCISEAYLNNVATLDISDPNLLALFISAAGKPQDLGPVGNFPTGAQPIIYFNTADASSNLGSGGNYINAAVLAFCSTIP